MQILVPISGNTPFFPRDEFYFPKPLIEIAGQPMIKLVIEQFKSQFTEAKFIFVVDRDDVTLFSLDRTLGLLAGEGTVVIEKPGTTSGALCSCLLSIDKVDPSLPLLVTNSDQLISEDLATIVCSFEARKAAAGVVTFDSVHPRWSYIADDGASGVVQTYEKRVVSRNAIAGFYYFNTAKRFFDAAKQVILNDAQTNGQYFISSVLNEMILSGSRLLHWPINPRSYHSFYAPSKIEEFERTGLADKLREGNQSNPIVNVIIPAAGEGSRFLKAGWKKPKPFIDVDGLPMIEHVIRNVTPDNGVVTVVLRQSQIARDCNIVNQLERSVQNIVFSSGLTEGTASTVLLARHSFDEDQPMLIANSDQLVDFDVNIFIDDCISRKLDGSIVVFKDVTRNPKWSFVKLNESNMVTQVAEKEPISDYATAGIYLFRSGSCFVDSALDMILANDRVNNEYYTCPVYNYMIKKGAKIGIFEVSKEAMSGLGTPEDLLAYLLDRKAPISADSPN
jgi:NDP-sugar pyrophosphorylase family protein